MKIKYDRTDFLEFFDAETIIDQEKNILEYKIRYQDGNILTLMLFLNDEKAIAKLYTADFEAPLFDVEINEIKKITCDKSLVRFYKDAVSWHADPFFKILIHPYASWQHEI